MTLSRTNAALAAMDVLLVVWALLIYWIPATPPDDRAQGTPSPSVRLPPDIEPPQIVRIDSLLTSPIFYQSRTLLDSGDERNIDSTANYVMTAVLIVPNRTRVAYLRSLSDDHSVIRVQEGTEFNGWTVKSIDFKRVMAVHNASIKEILPEPVSTGPGLIRSTNAAVTSSRVPPAILGNDVQRAAISRPVVGRHARTYRAPPQHAPSSTPLS